jgi:nitroimidazol reductase NimA-like FMN-containing flavoprotein (pyridoxamine 5'-phosphate oxidase superfamily)
LNTDKFRLLRRAAQALSPAECEEILSSASCGVLSLCGDGGYPYGVPVNYCYSDGKITFHCAKQGHKIDAIRRCDKVSFCVIAQDDVISEKRTTAYISVIVFGRAKIIEDEASLRKIALDIGKKYSADYEEDCIAETEEYLAKGKLCCVEITAEHISGKCGREVMKERGKQE